MSIRRAHTTSILVCSLVLVVVGMTVTTSPGRSRATIATPTIALPLASPSPFARVGADAIGTSQAAAAASAATIVVLQTANAGLQTRIALNPDQPTLVEAIEVHIRVPVAELLDGDETARATTRAELHRVLDQFNGCRAGLVQLYGHGPTLLVGEIQDGVDLANAVATEIRSEFPTIVGNAVLETAADLNPPRDQVDLRFYFFEDCNSAASPP